MTPREVVVATIEAAVFLLAVFTILSFLRVNL